MSVDNLHLPPCAGEYKGDGCGAFERYATNEELFIETDSDDERFPLLDDEDSLRSKLHSDFVDAGHCVFMSELAYRETLSALPPGVSSIVKPSQIAFSGCHVAVQLREHVGGHRLFSSSDMDDLIETLRPGGKLTDNDVSRCFTDLDEAFQARVAKYRGIIEDDGIDIPVRIEAAAAALYYFYDERSLDTACRIFFNRLTQANKERGTILELSDPEWNAWHQLVIALDYFEVLTPHIAERFAEALLINGFDSGIDVVKRAAHQSYLHFNFNLLASEVSKRSGTQAAHMSESVKSVSFLLLDIIAEKTDHGLSTTELIREFTSTGTCSDQSVEQTRLRLV